MLLPIFISTQLLFWLSLVIFALSHPGLSQSNNNKVSLAERYGINFTVFEHAATGVKLDFVPNSGICETTQEVNLCSGYISLELEHHLWFWLYAARRSEICQTVIRLLSCEVHD